ncbi:hypothetical protein DERP_004794 [Dermatophagoides pteronyssinus]|uniref:Uncharacterized protein n=1 Tax=Dermatophagoides pteronyssinus TaxID=6956 RepID=A0ABQ8JT10_DERPT|nr:hypothetical protein DERP_004794 [Dermatophagoides pteronyssinus]
MVHGIGKKVKIKSKFLEQIETTTTTTIRYDCTNDDFPYNNNSILFYASNIFLKIDQSIYLLKISLANHEKK